MEHAHELLIRDTGDARHETRDTRALEHLILKKYRSQNHRPLIS